MTARCCFPRCAVTHPSDRVTDVVSDGWSADDEGDLWCPACTARAAEELEQELCMMALADIALPDRAPTAPAPWGAELLAAAHAAGLSRCGIVTSLVPGFPSDREVTLFHAGGRIAARAQSLNDARALLLARIQAGATRTPTATTPTLPAPAPVTPSKEPFPMQKRPTCNELRPFAGRTVHAPRLRDLADACHADPNGLAVKVNVSTDPADCPEDCRATDGGL